MVSESSLTLPSKFCWTKIGDYSNQPAQEIAQRKDNEWRAGLGRWASVFWWGFGEPRAPAIRAYCESCIRDAITPLAVFTSPYRGCRYGHSVSGKRKIWTRYCDEETDGLCQLPEHVIMLRDPRKEPPHFALICHTTRKLGLEKLGTFDAGRYRNLNGKELQPGKPAHKGQMTTKVVEEVRRTSRGLTYEVAFIAEIVHPFVVKLYGDGKSLSQRKSGELIDEVSTELVLPRRYREIARHLRER